MIKFILTIAITIHSFQVYAEAFNVELTNVNTRVISPAKPTDPVSIVVKNSINMKVFSEIRSTDKVLSRFAIEPGSSKTIQIKLPTNQKLYYVSVSPPTQAVELKFNQRDYAVPEEK